MRAVLVATIVALGLASSSLAAEPRISRVAVDGERLTIEVAGLDQDRVKIVELRPYEKYVPGQNGTVVGEVAAETASLTLPRQAGTCDRLFAKFQLAAPQTGAAIGPVHYVDDLNGLAARDFDFLWAQGIKGVQSIVDIDDAIALGVKQAGCNVLISQVIDWANPAPSETWEVDGRQIPINTAGIAALDRDFQRLTDAGINITIIFLNAVPNGPQPGNPLLHPWTDLAGAPNGLGAFNLTDEAGLLHYRAAIEYLANRYSDPARTHGWVSGFIVGNELQGHWWWYNLGRRSAEEVIDDYCLALRVTDLAARRYHARLRTYASLDHHWTATYEADDKKCLPGRTLVDRLARLSADEGNFPWHVADHPYPEDLNNPRTWEDRQAALSFSTPKITFKNLEVLPAYLSQEAIRYRGAPRRIILSEQGFNTPSTPDGEVVQAAAYVYAYYKVWHMPSIDAFILHRHVDHAHEGGLRLGLWTVKEGTVTTPDRKKLIWEVFKYADTPEWEAHFEFAKPILGIRDWHEILPRREVDGFAVPFAEKIKR